MHDYDQIFEASYSRVIGSGTGLSEKGDDFFSSFYNNFLNKSRMIADKFRNTDMDRQVSMLQKSFFAVASIHISSIANDHLFKVAESHSRTGHNINPEFYDLWLDALIETVAHLDPEFEPDVELAWRLALTPGIVMMKHYYDNPIS